MAQHVVVVVEVASIQRYIFSTNKLREQIGASHLVRLATEEWIDQALRDHQLNPAKEKIYAGGGKTTLLLPETHAKDFTRTLTERVLKDAPGLQIHVAHSAPFDYTDQGFDLHGLVQATHMALKQSRMRSVSAPLLGLGVTAACSSTGLVATGMSNKPPYNAPDAYLISQEVGQKLKAAELAHQYLLATFPSLSDSAYDVPRDFDNFGRSDGDQSYIAVVHIDGNNIGQRIQDCGEGLSNIEYREQIRTLSDTINQVGKAALEIGIEQMLNTFKSDKASPEVVRFLAGLKRSEYPEKKGLPFIPFRPLVYGGDDVTFVCDGRLGLPLATSFLRAFEAASQKPENKALGPAHACAGVAIVKTHYPFARAYALCEDLIDSAKDLSKAYNKEVSALDWHLAPSGLLGDLEEIRRREYSVPQGDLTLRPVLVAPQAGRATWRTWANVKAAIGELAHDENWAGRRNKVMALQEQLRSGPHKTEHFLITIAKEARLPAYDNGADTLRKTGWDAGRCGYFDPIELLDFYLPLEES